MTDPANTPDPDGQVADAVSGNWVDTLAPAWSRPLLRLSRADRPIGTWLLLLPCWWAVLLAGLQYGFVLSDLWIIAGCAIGAFLMRGAGCTWNDVTDRRIDAQVARTRSRPIPSGHISARCALIWMGAQALVAFAVLTTFHPVAIWLGVGSLALITIYPFAKRFTWWPQVFLGLAFNWGALLAWAAKTGSVGWPAVALYLSGIAWTLFYDTIYAHQDKEDDALIGVKSTARLFADRTQTWLRAFMMISVSLMILAILMAVAPGRDVLALIIGFGAAWGFGWHMVWQLRTLNTEDPEICLRLFKSNRNAGLIPLLFFAVALMV